MKLKILIEISGNTDGDLELAFEEVVKSIKNGNITGSDMNEEGSYFFEVKNPRNKVAEFYGQEIE